MAGSLVDFRHYSSSITFAEVLKTQAAERPGQRAFVFLGSRGEVADELTFSGLHSRARSVAAELTRRDLTGKRVLLSFRAGLDFVVAIFGCFYAGVTAVPTPSPGASRTAERVANIVRDADPAGVLTSSKQGDDVGLLGAALADVRSLVTVYVDALDAVPSELTVSARNPADLAILQYTSGSISAPKGVMLSHANLMANCAMIAKAFGHDETLRGVGWLPTFHDMGLVGHVLQPVYVGGLSVLMSPASFLQRPVQWLKAISDWKATTSGGPTYAFGHCLKMISLEQAQDLSLASWKVAYCGSEKVHADVLSEFANRFEAQGFCKSSLVPCYGLAEATLLVTAGVAGTPFRSSAPDNVPRREAEISDPALDAVSCGRAWCDASVIVADPNTRGRLNDGRVGEIWCRGPHVAPGYWNRASESEVAFQARLVDGEGPYLRTGDLGFIRNGELFVSGRMKDVVVIRGLQRAAEDLEGTVTRSHGAFSGLPAAAFATEAGSQEKLVIVLEIGRTAIGSDEQNEAVQRAFASITREHGLRLSDFVLVRLGSLPRTSSGKVQRSRCRVIYESGGFRRLNRPTAFS